jgi:hypothetical protein
MSCRECRTGPRVYGLGLLPCVPNRNTCILFVSATTASCLADLRCDVCLLATCFARSCCNPQQRRQRRLDQICQPRQRLQQGRAKARCESQEHCLRALRSDHPNAPISYPFFWELMSASENVRLMFPVYLD